MIAVGLVARSTRAWIETLIILNYGKIIGVARSTRAWIETSICFCSVFTVSSHALRVRGLKPLENQRINSPGHCRTLYACVD